MDNTAQVTKDGTKVETQNAIPSITVKWSTLVEGIGLTFTGITKMLTALDPHTAKHIAEIVAKVQDSASKDEEAAPDTQPEPKVPEEKHAIESEVKPVEEEPTDAVPVIPAVTLDDVTKVIVQKIKQNRGNNEKIGSILKTYGVCKVSELPKDKYEAFLTDLAQL